MSKDFLASGMSRLVIEKKIHPIAISLRRLIKNQTQASFPTNILSQLTHPETSTAMKRISLSKSARSIALLTILSITVGTAATSCTSADSTKPLDTPVVTASPDSAKPLDAPVAATPSTKAETIVDIAVGNPDFSTLVTAVKAAGLAETLSGKGPFTLFAPTNEAFAALPKGTVEKLLKPENRDALKKVLTYHVVAGDLMAKDLRSGKVATVEGGSVAVKVQGQTVSVNSASVVKADIDAKNGVVHVIDKVLLPPNL
jgi:uncharacterized surface protein with fasciclin (FAS1) repeats